MGFKKRFVDMMSVLLGVVCAACSADQRGAQLEAGVATETEQRRGRKARRRDGLHVEATVAPSAFPQLSLVEVKVRAANEDDRVLFTLRQLVRVPDHRTSGGRP